MNSAGSASLETIKFLIENGANVNGCRAKEYTPLRAAVSSNRADVVQYLIDQGADVNLSGRESCPLTVAIQKGFFEIVKILVENGADLNYKEGWTDGKDTPLEIAESMKSQRIIDYIRSALNDK